MTHIRRFSNSSSDVVVTQELLHGTLVANRKIANGDAASDTERVRSDVASGIHTSVQNIEELYSVQRRNNIGFVHGKGQLSVIVSFYRNDVSRCLIEMDGCTGKR